MSTSYSQRNVLRTIEDILGTEHINLNTYYARPMADVFNTDSFGKWIFKAVASTLLTAILTKPVGPIAQGGGFGTGPEQGCVRQGSSIEAHS